MSPEGTFVAVVGPSGAGKDTLMARAARHASLTSQVGFVRRIVTRDALAEDHDSLNEAAFARAQAAGAFCLSWAAHGLRYALPRSLNADLRDGRTMVANLSRGALADAAALFGTLRIVEVTADPAILLQRISARGREGVAEARDRLARQAVLTLPPGAGLLRIDNSGDVEVATEAFVRHLNALGGHTRHASERS